MAPAQDKEKHSLTTDQTKLLCEVITKANVTLTPVQWNEIAASLGISNGKAAKERYRYMMNSLSGLPSRAAKNDNGTKDPNTPRSAVKKAKAPSTPASTKPKATKQSAKKRKLDEDEENTATNEKEQDASDAQDDIKPAKTPRPEKVKNLATPFQTPKKAELEVNSNDDNATNDEDVDSDSTKVESSAYSGTTTAETPKPVPEPQDLETLFEEDGFGAIGGGDGSMFPESEDVI